MMTLDINGIIYDIKSSTPIGNVEKNIDKLMMQQRRRTLKCAWRHFTMMKIFIIRAKLNFLWLKRFSSKLKKIKRAGKSAGRIPKKSFK